MPKLHSLVNKHSAEFNKNYDDFLTLIHSFRSIEQAAADGAERMRQRFHANHQLMPHERLGVLLDINRPFYALSSLAGLNMHDDQNGSAAGGGNIIGLGCVCGTYCMIIANNSAIKGGAISPMGLKKILRAQEIALENRLPVIYLVESAGANLLYQSEVFIDGAQVFAQQARLSALGIPQIAVVHGPSTAGGAYLPGLADYVIMVQKKAKVYLAGPPLLKAATGEIATEEALGGADMHAQIAGTTEYLAEDDKSALLLARDLCRQLQWKPYEEFQNYLPPHYDIDELLGIVPTDYRYPYDVREVIARLTDDSAFLEFKSNYDQDTLCGHAHIHGHACGIIGNNGPITAHGATKAAQFIQLLSQANLPIIYLQNTTGFMVGTESEQQGIVKHGSKLIQAVTNAQVPQITLMIGASFGAGNYAMCGRGFSPRFVFSWPNSRVGVMGGEQAAKVMSMLQRQKIKPGTEVDESQIQQQEKAIIDKMQTETSALYATARLWDDGIIDPRHSRQLLGFLLNLMRQAKSQSFNANTFGVARL